MFLQVSVCPPGGGGSVPVQGVSVQWSLSRGSLSRGLCPAGSLSSLVSVQGGLCSWGVSVQGSLSRGVSVQGSLSGGLCPGGVSV